MKNQIRQAWFWQGLMVMVFFMTAGANNAFSDSSDCANLSELALDGHIKIKFCDIPAAQDILIGSINGRPDEQPVRARYFRKFQMAQFEVTQLQYKTVAGSEPWKGKPFVRDGDNYPAVHISYKEAQQFVDALSQIDKTATYRLPTEAEFEHAARAGTATDYYWGNKMNDKMAYYRGNTVESSGRYARQVDSCPDRILNEKYPGYCANSFGLYHMLGNVWELTDDAYMGSYANAPKDGNVPVYGGNGSPRVLRGGSWADDAWNLRSANRYYTKSPDDHYGNVGFRIVRIDR